VVVIAHTAFPVGWSASLSAVAALLAKLFG